MSVPSTPGTPSNTSRTRRWPAVLALAISLPLLGASPVAAAPQAVAQAAAPAVVAPQAAKKKATSLRVGSFNIRCANCSITSRTNSREKRWETRRAKVISQLKAEKVDVVGLQEASQGLLSGTKISQFEDLANRLGGGYRLVNAKRYPCAKDTSYKNCDRVNNGASSGVRIIYDADRLTVLDQGSKQLDDEALNSGPRFVAWAIFRDKKDKREFFFATAHTEPGQSAAARALRKKQAGMIMATIRANNPDRLPVVLTGDFSASKLTAVNPAYDVILDSDLVIDPLGNSHKMKTTAKATAKKLINIKYDSLNKFNAKPTSRKNYAIGANVDYIFTSKSIKVSEYKVVLNLKSNGKYSGTIPSDHHLLRATILLP